jgi:hypothetical protein
MSASDPSAAPAVEEPQKSTGDPFLDAVKGRVPLSKNVSAARTWSKTGAADFGPYVPRPDIDLTLLRACSIGGILGLDHFLLRSTTTGFFKLLLGAIFIAYVSLVPMNSINWIIPMVLLLWVIWDVLQVFFESDRVMNYGMSLPFDFMTGIGQGMVTDTTFYKQKYPFIAWGLSLILGFIGIDSLLMGKAGLFVRKFLDGLMLFFTSQATVNGNYGWLVLAIPLFFFLGIPWLYNMYFFLFKPADMFENGIALPDALNGFLNFFLMWFQPGKRDAKTNQFINETERQKNVVHEAMRSDFGYGSISAIEMKEKFSVLYPGEPVISPPGTAEDSWIGRWLLSSFLSNIYTGPLSVGIWRIVNWCLPLSSLSIETIYTGSPPSLSPMMIPGFSSIASGLPTALPTAASLGLPSALPSAASLGLPSALPSAASLGPPSAADALNAARRAAAGLDQRGGARNAPLSTESKILGAAVIALITGGGMKGLVDYLMKE